MLKKKIAKGKGVYADVKVDNGKCIRCGNYCSHNTRWNGFCPECWSFKRWERAGIEDLNKTFRRIEKGESKNRVLSVKMWGVFDKRTNIMWSVADNRTDALASAKITFLIHNRKDIVRPVTVSWEEKKVAKFKTWYGETVSFPIRRLEK